MPKIIFIDKSIRSRQGHNLEYCLRLADPCRQAGYDVAFIANSSFSEPLPNITVEPAIRFIPLVAGRHPLVRVTLGIGQSLSNVAALLKVRAKFSIYGQMASILLDAITDRKVSFEYKQAKALLHPTTIIIGLVGGIIVLPIAIVCVPLYILRRRFAPHIWGQSAIPRKILRKAVKVARNTARFLSRAIALTKAKDKKQAADIRCALMRLKVSADDIIVFPTFTLNDMRVLLKLLDPAQKPIQCQSWNVIFREPLFQTPIHQTQLLRQHRLIRTLIAKLIETKAPLSFWTDTTELSEQYNLLSTARFGTLPIALADNISVLSKTPLVTKDRPICLGYIGDARQEKGYGLLPGMFDSINGYGQVKRPTCGLIQSNFNVPNGTDITRPAKLRLKFQDDLNVKLVDRTQTSEEYAELLKQMDVVLIPYASPLYHAGSSGVLAEALAAGKPVVVTERTWAGRQIRESAAFRQYLADFVSQFSIKDDQKMAIPEKQLFESPTARTVPANCSHVAIRADFGLTTSGDVLEIMLEQKSDNGDLLGKQSHFFSGRYREAHALWTILDGAHTIILTPKRLHLSLTNNNCTLTLIPCSTQGCDVPISAVGALIEEPINLTGDHPSFAAGVVEVVNHFPHYNQTAMDNAAPWNMVHNAANLAAALLKQK